MKKNNVILKDCLLTPFRFIAGWESLFSGLLLILFISYLAYTSGTYFDGALDVHFGCQNDQSPYLLHLWYQLCSWICLTLILHFSARIVSRSSIRILDMAGTLALSRVPLIFLALFGFIPFIHICFDHNDINTIITLLKENIIWIGLISIITLPFIIWWIVLMYNAFSVSSNLKGNKGIITFITGLIIAEILSKILNYFIVPLF